MKILKSLFKKNVNLDQKVSSYTESPSVAVSQFSLDWDEVFQTPALSLHSLGKSGGAKTIPQAWGESFRELSPYTQGANPKGIYWPRWVQSQELVLKKYDLPQQGKLGIVIDETGSMNTGKQYHYARVCAAKLATACLKAGHSIQVYIERDQSFYQAPVASKLEHLISTFSFLKNEPMGLSCPPEKRAKYLAQITAQDYLIYLSDALFTIDGSQIRPLDRPKEQESQEVLSSVIEQLGPSLKAMYCLYICCIDPDADRPHLHETLRSAESIHSTEGALDSEMADFVYDKLIQYRRCQKELIQNQQARVQWYDLNAKFNFDPQFKEIIDLLRLH